ncbi:hypothetical protein CW731_07245 [Polaribacter sp. ALD11]|uniref:hypothetical protein n=1 Tax=Polaribacter sp. ALD11 TaxID=2058137 RepID=UPI000C30DFB7|nr:hypothetical protein [Polaribacter sp. ALD11]AUC85097.1 hypothetical protein CW731_07245 [Polaribacter sp. ALD11]
MANKRIIKCPNCGVFNTNKDYCENCNTLISHQKKRELKVAAVKKKEVDEAIFEKENPNLAERLKNHSNILYKIFGWILYSAITIVSAIGVGLAWFIAMVAAG